MTSEIRDLIAKPQIAVNETTARAIASCSDELARVLRSIILERHRQTQLIASGNLTLPMDAASPDLPNGAKMMVLGAQFGAVSSAAAECYRGHVFGSHSAANLDHLQQELVQLATVAIAWAESIEKEAA